MMTTVRTLNRWVNHHSGKFLWAGLFIVGLYNLYGWKKDKTFLARKTLARKAGPTLPLPLENWPSLPKVSILVAAWNESSGIQAHIQSFQSLRYPNKELILCAGGIDGTYRMASAWAGAQVKVLEQTSGQGKQRALRNCLSEAAGSVIYLTDADCLLDNESFERVIYPLATGEELACSGTSRPSREQIANAFVAAQAASQLYSALHRPDYTGGLLGRNCAVSRPVLERSGGFDQPAPAGTDYVLAKVLTRSGVRIRQIPESQVITRYPTKVNGYIQQQRRWLRNVALHGKRFGSMNEMRASLLTSLVGLAMLIIPLISLFTGPMLLVAWALLFLHTLAARARYLRFLQELRILPLKSIQFHTLPGIVLVDFIAWTLPFIDYLQHGEETW